MINIRPVSDLRNRYPEIEDLVLREDEAVYLTKNGYGSMVVMSLEKYEKLTKNTENSENVSINTEKETNQKDIQYISDENEDALVKLRKKIHEYGIKVN